MAQADVFNIREYKARQLVEDGKYQISIGDMDAATDTFQKSLEIFETAEAFNYLGWVLSLQGQLDLAIELCKKAIALDPNFGNSLNDMGSYLMQKDRLEESIPWFEKAKTAPHYEPRHFPYINLGRVYSAQGKIDEAILEFKLALKFSPGHPEVLKVLEQLEIIRNSEVNA